MENLKNTIKELSSQQQFFKNQRKSIHLVGERIISPYAATSKHLNNRHILRLMYAVQGLLKGKSLEEVETHNRPETYPLSYYRKEIDNLLAKYAEVTHSN